MILQPWILFANTYSFTLGLLFTYFCLDYENEKK